MGLGVDPGRLGLRAPRISAPCGPSARILADVEVGLRAERRRVALTFGPVPRGELPPLGPHLVEHEGHGLGRQPELLEADLVHVDAEPLPRGGPDIGQDVRLDLRGS